MKNQQTCGPGLAEHSVLPAKVGELIASLAEILELHMKALDLPMGRHDQEARSFPKVREVFEEFVTLEQELRALLQKRLEEDRRMLVEMAGAGGGRS